MPNEIFTQTQNGKRIAYTRKHVGCDDLSLYASGMTDYSEDERMAAQEIIAYTSDACFDLVTKGGIITKSRIVRRGIAALDIPELVRAQFDQGPIADTRYQHFQFPITPGLKLNMSGNDRVFVVAPFPKDLTIVADGISVLKLLTSNGKTLENWTGFSTMMERVVKRYYDMRDCSTLVARASIISNAFADAVVANRK